MFFLNRRFVGDHLYFGGCIFILNYFTALWDILYAESGWNILVKLVLAAFSSFFVAFLIIIPLVFIPLGWKKLYQGVWLAFLLLVNILEMFMLYHFHSLMVSSFLVVFLQTNPAEMSEFIHTYLSGRTLIFFIAGGLLCWYLLYWFCVRKCSCLFIWKNSKKPLIWCMILILLSGAGITFYIQYRYMKGVVSLRTTTPIQRLVYAISDGIHDMNDCRKIASEIKDIDFKVEVDSGRIQNVVLIIGESLGKNHMSLYGYPYPTTPFLDSLYKQGDLIRFNDVVTSATTTVESLKTMFTFYNRDSKGLWYGYPLLSSLMKKGGYTTSWLSNQESCGLWGNLISTIARRYDKVVYNQLRSTNDNVEGAFDLQLLPLIEKQWKSEKANFMVIHLMGSHLSYNKRYPSNFNYFQATDYQDILACGKKCTDYLKTKAAYDNSVLYNDFVLKQFLQFFSDKEVMVCYVADHGEEVYDFRNFMGHGQIADLSRYMVEVPMLVWMSDTLREKYPILEERMEVAVDRPYMTDDLVHFFIDIMGIKTPLYDPSRSVVNEKFNENRRRLVNGVTDYDIRLKNRH